MTAITPWMKVGEAANRAQCSPKVLYREVKAGRLRAARLGGRRELRFLAEHIDQWLSATMTEGNRDAA
jgi:excisionase family DNA binding protein